MTLQGSDRFADNSGFSLMEVAVALGIVAVALAGLAPVLLQCTIVLRDAAAESRAVVAAISRMEELAALSYSQELDTLALVTDESTNFEAVPPTATGTGLLPQGADTAWLRSPGFGDWLTMEGGNASSGAHDAVTTRRWALSALPDVSPAEALMVQVFARADAREQSEAVRVSPARRPGDIWLFSVRGRTLR